jgi:hypothetical protein
VSHSVVEKSNASSLGCEPEASFSEGTCFISIVSVMVSGLLICFLRFIPLALDLLADVSQQQENR